MKTDYYDILGVARDASVSDIKKKYRSLALKNHPDRVPEEKKKEAEERFKEISEAYGVLSDPKKKQMYDQYGHAGIDQNYTSDDIFRGADFGDIFGDSGFGDVFSQFFGGGGGGFGGRGRRGPARGRDIQYEVELTLQEAFKGVKKKVRVPRNEVCKSCNGNGAKDGTALETCQSCQGTGQVVISQGFFRMQQACPTCGGSGKSIKENCPECHGAGHTREVRNIEVTFPKGLDNDSQLRVRGEGEIAAGGAGDLYLYIRVKSESGVERRGNDLHMVLPVSFVKAALGAEVSVKTLHGNVTMKIPAGTQSGKTFRLREKGMPDLRSGHFGDLYVRVMIEVPTKLTKKQRALLEEYAQVSGEKVLKEESLTEKVKKVFK